MAAISKDPSKSRHLVNVAFEPLQEIFGAIVDSVQDSVVRLTYSNSAVNGGMGRALVERGWRGLERWWGA